MDAEIFKDQIINMGLLEELEYEVWDEYGKDKIIYRNIRRMIGIVIQPIDDVIEDDGNVIVLEARQKLYKVLEIIDMC